MCSVIVVTGILTCCIIHGQWCLSLHVNLLYKHHSFRQFNQFSTHRLWKRTKCQYLNCVFFSSLCPFWDFDVSVKQIQVAYDFINILTGPHLS